MAQKHRNRLWKLAVMIAAAGLVAEASRLMTGGATPPLRSPRGIVDDPLSPETHRRSDILAGGTLAVSGGKSQTAHWRRIDQSQYVGAKRCAKCHRAYYDGWKQTAHNKMIRPAITTGPRRTVLADFSQPSPYRHFDLKDVKWVIGHRWKQRYIGEVNGKEVVFPAQWSIKEKKWQPYHGKTD